MAVANGYGKHIEEVSNAEFDIIMKVSPFSNIIAS